MWTGEVRCLKCARWPRAPGAERPRRRRPPGPSGRDGLEFQLLFWIADPENGQLNVRSDVNIAVLKALRAAGIDIPYPQRVLHLKALLPGGPAATS
jgi:hypothetical protein